MRHDVSKFIIGEVIHGRGISVRIVYVCKISGLIVAEKICEWLPSGEREPKITFFHGQRIKFAPQTYFSNSWVSLPPQPQFVLCVRADGIKVLG